MKLNYVSVLKEYKTKNNEGGYFVRGELDGQPSALWFKNFKTVWMSTLAYRKLCSEPLFNRSEILIPILEGNSIPATVEALRSVVSKLNNPYINIMEGINIDKLDQEII